MSEENNVNLGKIMAGIAQAAKKWGTTQVANRGEDSPRLPLPISQAIGESAIVWKWETLVPHLFVTAHLYSDETYSVFIDGAEPEDFTAEQSFSIGQALCAAGGYKENWQDFAGQFIANGFLKKEKTVKPKTIQFELNEDIDEKEYPLAPPCDDNCGPDTHVDGCSQLKYTDEGQDDDNG